MKSIIVDDDPCSRKYLSVLCQDIPTLQIVASCASASEAIHVMKNENIDLLLLDIEMPEMSGIELVRSMTEKPQVIFVTSKSEYATDAFECNATDFIQKPFDQTRLARAIDKAISLRTMQLGRSMDEIYVKADGRLVRIDLKDVIYIESLGDYVIFHTEHKTKLIVHATLKYIDETILHPDFLKVHRSYIINLSKIVDIQDANLQVKDKVIPVSRANRASLMNSIRIL